MPNINENSPVADQPAKCLVKLKWHQLTMIRAMLDAESKCEITYEKNLRHRKETSTCNVVQKCNVGFVADKVSSGKTFIILGLICTKQIPDLVPIPGDGGTVITMPSKPVRANLIIVPHSLVTQWQSFIKQTTLKTLCLPNQASLDCFYDFKYTWDRPSSRLLAAECVSVNAKKDAKNYFADQNINIPKGVSKLWRIYDLNEERTIEIFNSYDVVLISDTNYKNFQNITIDIKWARVIYDDAHQIKCKLNEYGSFYWVVTATPTNDLLAFGHISADLKHITYKNDDDFVDRQMTVPPPKAFIIRTGMDASAKAVAHLVPQDILALINAGNIQGAVSQLNCGIDTKENILQAFTKSLKLKAQILTDKIEMLEKHQGMGANNANKIAKLKADLALNDEKISDIEQRLGSIDSELCFICACEYENPTITECCKHVFCLLCLTTAISKTKLCPYCRQKPKYKLIQEIKPEAAIVEFAKLDKIKSFIALLDKMHDIDPKARIIVFSEQIDHCFSVCKSKNIKYSYARFKGTAKYLDETLAKYNNGNLNILLFDPKHYGSGINIQSTDYVILLHRLTPGLEIQGIGRAQRYGRTNALKIIYLVDESECDQTTWPTTEIMTVDEIETM